jgi:hypothetical protein
MATTPVNEKVQIWFRFLNLAYKSKDPELIALLDANKSKYEQWGNYRTTSWSSWWKKHSHLFATQKVQVITEDDEFPADTIVISIPFDKPKSQVGNTVKRLYSKAVEERGRVTRLSQFKFSTNPKTGKEHLVYAEKMRTYLAYASEVYVPVMNSGGYASKEELIAKSIEALQKYKTKRDNIKGKTKRYSRRGQQAKVTILDMHRHDYLKDFNSEQQVNRMTVYAENLLFNVASGIFPGEYNQKRKPTKLKIVKSKVAKVSHAKATTTSTQSRYLQNKRIDGVNPYASWTPAKRAAHEKRKAEKNQTKK